MPIVSSYDAWIGTLPSRPEWQRDAACRGLGVHRFVPDSAGGSVIPPPRQVAYVVALCSRCRVKRECENYAEMMGAVGWWAGRWRRGR